SPDSPKANLSSGGKGRRRRRPYRMTRDRAITGRSVLIALLAALLARSSPAATPEQVETALQKAKAYLYTQQNPQGTWDKRSDPPDAAMRKAKGFNYSIDGGQWGGMTALVTYALVAAGDSAQSDKLIPAVNF